MVNNILLPDTIKNRNTLRTLSFARELLLLDGESQHSSALAIVDNMMSQIPDYENPGKQTNSFSQMNNNLISLFDWYACLQDLSGFLKKISADRIMISALDYSSAVIFDEIVSEDKEYSRKSIEEADDDIRKTTDNAEKARRAIASRVWKLIREVCETENKSSQMG